VLIDHLRAYEANDVSLDPAALPMDATLATPSITVTPAFRSGALVRFPVSRGDAAVLRLVLPDGRSVPAGAQVMVGGVAFPVALDGLVQVSGVAEAVNAEARWDAGHCGFHVERSEGAGPIPDLGAVTCTPVKLAARP
jgi:outer membrane usher protein